jgi:hypothetical protein
MPYRFVRDQRLYSVDALPADAKPIGAVGAEWLPPLVTTLHQSLAAWGALGHRPGPLTAERVWVGSDGTLIVYDPPGKLPLPLLHIGMAPELAAWLVLLDKWMETFVVVARARSVWTHIELAGALTFLTPVYLPATLIAQPPNNWERVARAVAIAVADGPLQGEPTNQHWTRTSEGPSRSTSTQPR